MADAFLTFWFRALEQSIGDLDHASREHILQACGQACSDSYTRQVYTEAYEASRDFDDFLNRLRDGFPEAGFRVDGEEIELTYAYCACELVKGGYMREPFLCECSRQSLLYNWGSLFGQDRVSVELQASILSGNPCCRFLISAKAMR